MREYDYLVFMGRYQPLHNGHLHVIREALERTEKLIILIGSANIARSPRNPFTYREREQMLRGVELPEPERLIVLPVADHPYNDHAWIGAVQRAVHVHTGMITIGRKDPRIGLVGHAKDHTSYYLKLFPDWKSLDVTTRWSLMDATSIRQQYLQRAPQLPDLHLVPPNVRAFLTSFMLTEDFKWLVEEQEFYTGYMKSWEGSPFPPFFCCVDAVVVQSGHILLVRRGEHPGKGLLALPGGHVNVNETFRDAVIRELKEETKISDEKGQIPPAMLASFIEDAKTRLFDAPYRSPRGRVVTQAYLFAMPQRTKLFSVRGSDDAASAVWHTLGSLRAPDFHDDHAAIIEEMTGHVLRTY